MKTTKCLKTKKNYKRKNDGQETAHRKVSYKVYRRELRVTIHENKLNSFKEMCEEADIKLSTN